MDLSSPDDCTDNIDHLDVRIYRFDNFKFCISDFRASNNSPELAINDGHRVINIINLSVDHLSNSVHFDGNNHRPWDQRFDYHARSKRYCSYPNLNNVVINNKHHHGIRRHIRSTFDDRLDHNNHKYQCVNERHINWTRFHIRYSNVYHSRNIRNLYNFNHFECYYGNVV
eukprot:GDKK01073003.1.p2 GENE.GDKK01073003.1~~GDKK01073003.1.p2  ORF type:complete len:170 (+),score=30.09 GDKK01073003.1:13-522(+)